MLGTPADGEAIDQREPGLLCPRRGHAIGLRTRRNAALDLAEVSELASQQEIDQRDLAVVQVGQVDAGAEDPPARVLRMGHRRSAQHADADFIVEQREVDAGLQGLDRLVILGVEVLEVAQRQPCGAALALDHYLAEVRGASGAEAGQRRHRPAGRPQHRLDQVGPGAPVAQDGAEEDSLAELVSLLVRLPA